MSRFVIGIDLGTTSSSVFYADTFAERPRPLHFKIPQLNAHDHLEHLPSLASFYLKGEYPLPWDKHRKFAVGTRALTAGEKNPTLLVQSAKSWLCHSAAARQNPILPPEAASEADRISPVVASVRYLSHIRESWNHSFAKGDPDALMEEQEVVLTVPASFDEGARTLTLQAAQEAGFRHITLLEEPQAAFYAWIEKNPQKSFPEGTEILVADVGGGTTDFSLITYKEGTFTRQAVGDHLLLGGDNIDHAIAHALLKKLKQSDLPLSQWLQLKHESRRAKEEIYSGAECYRVYFQGGGSKVIGGGQTVEINRAEMDHLVLEGFFPLLEWKDAVALKRKSALASMGLPYESDPAITKHLAAFYHAHAEKGAKGPDYVLFNGGSFKPEPFRQAVLQSFLRWFPESPVQELPSHNLDLAVALGACCYGLARRGIGMKIRGGSARAFYLEIEDQKGEKRALTLLPRGEEEGYLHTTDQIFQLKANSAVSFQLYSSHVRIEDPVESVIPIDPLEMHPLPLIQTHLRFGKGDQSLVPVRLEVTLTSLGTLALQLKSQQTSHVWKLEFQLKSVTGQEDALLGMGDKREEELFDEQALGDLKAKVKCYFEQGETKTPFFEPIEQLVNLPKGEWTISLLRALADATLEASSCRHKSSKLRERWWNVIGYFLRPGYGYPLDDFRIKSLWKCVLEDRTVLDDEEKVHYWIALRRVSGGLSRGQQQQIASELVPTLSEKVRGGREEYLRGEKIRLLGALEWLDRSVKLKWGTSLVNKIVSGKGDPADFWALGRIGSRILLYAPLSALLPVGDVSRWIERLLESKQVDHDKLRLLLEQIGRKTEFREVNIPEGLVQGILEKFPESKAISQVLAINEDERALYLGDKPPPGLRII